jgi:hypothetical protein
MSETIIPQAVAKANALPKPLNKRQRAIVAQRDAVTAEKLKGLEAAFAKPERKRDKPEIKSKDSNGWTR